MNEEQVREIIRDELYSFITMDKFIFRKNIQIIDGRTIQTGRGTGTKFPQSSDQKWGAFGVTPVVQQSAITKPAGGANIDSEARTAINSLIDAIKAIGLTA